MESVDSMTSKLTELRDIALSLRGFARERQLLDELAALKAKQGV